MKKPPGGIGKFAPKLTFEDRCGYFYAALIKTPTNVLALASGMNHGTISRLANIHSGAYRNIHAHFEALGREEFRNRYFSKAIIDRVAAAQLQVAAHPEAYTPPQEAYTGPRGTEGAGSHQGHTPEPFMYGPPHVPVEDSNEG